MSPVTIEVRGLSGSISVPVPGDEPTVADLREAGGFGDDLAIRSQGQTVSDDEPLVEGSPYVTTPPAAKHGRS